MKSNRGILLAHIAVLFFGLSGVLAKLIDQSAIVVTGIRTLLGSIILGVFLYFSTGLKFPKGRSMRRMMFSGALLSLHWIAFYHSIKISTISIGVVAVSTFPVMTALVEPFVMKEKWSWKNVIDPLLVVLGTGILLGFDPSSSELHGVFFGFLAAAIYVIIHFINKIEVNDMTGSQVSSTQLLIAGTLLLPFTLAGFDVQSPELELDIIYSICLALFCTAIAYSLFIESMRSLPARTVAVLSGLEPVYAVFIAVSFLNEPFSWNLVFGAAIILFSVGRSTRRSMGVSMDYGSNLE